MAKKKMIGRSWGSRVFSGINAFFLILIMLITFYPLYYVAITSISNGMLVMQGKVNLYPIGLTLDSYRSIMSDPQLFQSLWNSVVYTVVGTIINLVMSCLRSFLRILQNDDRWFIPYIGASSVLTISQMVLAYDEARSGLEYSIFHQNVYHVQQGGHPLVTRISYHAAEEAELLLNLQKGDLNRVKTSLEDLLKVYLSPEHSWRSLRQLFERIYRTVSLHMSSCVETEIPLDLQNCNIQQMVEVLMERFRRLLVTAGGPQSADSQQISSVCEYVKQHYRENLSLTSLSEAMGYSAKYLSRLFKENMSWNLSDYIQYVRIEKAKELLVQTRLSVEEIQEQVGIPSRTTFIRVFKKFEGLPPGQYRKLGAMSHRSPS